METEFLLTVTTALSLAFTVDLFVDDGKLNEIVISLPLILTDAGIFALVEGFEGVFVEGLVGVFVEGLVGVFVEGLVGVFVEGLVGVFVEGPVEGPALTFQRLIAATGVHDDCEV